MRLVDVDCRLVIIFVMGIQDRLNEVERFRLTGSSHPLIRIGFTREVSGSSPGKIVHREIFHSTGFVSGCLCKAFIMHLAGRERGWAKLYTVIICRVYRIR